MKKLFAVLLIAAGTTAALLSGCANSDGTAAANGKLYVYNWGEYIDPDVITSFEQETGIKVIYDMFESNEIMYAKIAQDDSAYDVICPSDYMIQKMIDTNLVQPLDYSKIPDAKANIGQEYWDKSQQFDAGNKYSVPYCWGTVGILYNKTMVSDPVDSWNILWNSKYKGEILMQDSVRDAYMVALKKNGFSANTTDKSELEKATADLIAQKPLVQAYVVDQVRDKMIGNEAALGVIYSGEAIYTKRENPDLEYVVPKEGTNIWIDSWVITKDSKNRENALKWINYMCRDDIALKNFEYITYSTPNKKAQAEISDADIRNSKIAFPDLKAINTETYSYLGEEYDRMYNDYWMQVKSADY